MVPSESRLKPSSASTKTSSCPREYLLSLPAPVRAVIKLSLLSETESSSRAGISSSPRELSDVGVVKNAWPLNSGLRSNGGITGGVAGALVCCVRVDDRLTDRLSGLKMNVETGEGPIINHRISRLPYRNDKTQGTRNTYEENHFLPLLSSSQKAQHRRDTKVSLGSEPAFETWVASPLQQQVQE